MKRMLRVTTAALAVTSMFTMTAFASDPQAVETNGASATIDGDAWTVDPVIYVELPGDLAFGINPLSLDADEDGEADTQIVSSDYMITNYSNVPVLVETSTTLTGKTETVDILGDADYASNGDLKPSASDGKKAIWMVQLYPTAATKYSDAGVAELQVTALTATDKNAQAKGDVLGSTAAEAKFKLATYAVDDKEQTKPECISGFRFAGAVDPAATFTTEDAVKVSTVFTVKALTANQIANDYQTKTGYDTTVVEPKTP